VTFTDRVRGLHGAPVRQPTQRGFTLTAWDAAYQATVTDGTATLADGRLHHAGRWFHARFENTRQALIAAGTDAVDQVELVRVLVGYANATIATLHHLGPIEVTAALPTVGGSSSTETFVSTDLSQDGYLTRLLDIFRFPLREAVSRGDEPPASPRSSTSADLKRVLERLLPVATAYETLETLWGECVMHGWFVRETETLDLVEPVDQAREVARLIGQVREGDIRTQLVAQAVGQWPKLPSELREIFRTQPHVVRVVRAGRRRRLVIGPARTPPGEPPPTVPVELAAQTVYLGAILDQPLENIRGVTVREITRAWRVLASLGHLLLNEHLPARHSFEMPTVGEARAYAPAFERAELLRCLVRDAGFTAEHADAILDLFTFGRTPADELWLTPLVPVDDGLMVPALAPLTSPNLLRSQEHWLKVGGFAMDLRGGAFEQYMRDIISRAIRLPNAAAIKRSVTLTGAERPEEIDLVVRVGDVLLVGEVKCTLSPAVPVEFGRLFSLLDEAAGQVLRKCKAAGDQMHEVRRVTGWPDLPDNARILPVVVSNLVSAAGHTFRGVPVVDELLLTRFLGDGFVFHLVDARDAKSGRAKSVFYPTPADAPDALAGYLARPPQLEILQQLADWRTMDLIDMPGDAKPAAYRLCWMRVPDELRGPPSA
jgi:hypothetical protein